MLLFIVIFFALIIVVGAAAIGGFSIYLKRKNKSLASNGQKQFDEMPAYRSLFEPDDEEIRLLEREERAKVAAERKQIEENLRIEKVERVRAFEEIWRSDTNRQKTVELLRLVSETESAEIFSQTAENVIQVLLHEQTGILTSTDLADLLDSHLRALPQQERTSGAAFRIRQEIERLRGKSE